MWPLYYYVLLTKPNQENRYGDDKFRTDVVVHTSVYYPVRYTHGVELPLCAFQHVVPRTLAGSEVSNRNFFLVYVAVETYFSSLHSLKYVDQILSLGSEECGAEVLESCFSIRMCTLIFGVDVNVRSMAFKFHRSLLSSPDINSHHVIN